MNLRTRIARDFLAIERAIPSTFTRGADTGPCAVSSAAAGTDLIVGGKILTIRSKIFVRCDLFTTPPLARQAISVAAAGAAAAEYRIADVSTDAAGAHYELPLVGLDEL